MNQETDVQFSKLTQSLWESVYLSYDLGRLCIINGFQILLHCCVIVTFLMEVIPIPTQNHVALSGINASFLSKIDGQYI